MNTSIVITSISGPNSVLQAYAQGCLQKNYAFYVIGDTGSPEDFSLSGCDFFSVERQLQLPFELAGRLPLKHYSRKNIGYLLAVSNGSSVIIETDDDNIPLESFWNDRTLTHDAVAVEGSGWTHIYRYFSNRKVWARGFPLTLVNSEFVQQQITETVACPIQQGLVNENPDVDAVYRMTQELPVNFEERIPVALGRNSLHPFNSQNTTWLKDAFPLLYLPSYCSFRMTDIWRSFIAQRIAWTCGWSVLYHNATVYQERNDHNLLRDFEDEVSGYLNNEKICSSLSSLKLQHGRKHIYENLRLCYEEMIRNKWIADKNELSLLESWIQDISTFMYK